MAAKLTASRPKTASELLLRVRRDRERREVRLEHAQAKYLLAKWRRFWKDITGARQGPLARGCASTEANAHWLEGKGKARIEAVAGQAVSDRPMLSEAEKEKRMADLAIIVSEESQKEAVAITTDGLNELLLALDGECPDRGRSHITPLERGSLYPTVREYVGEAFPLEISTEEEAVRYLELRTSLAAYQQATSDREKRKGPGVCVAAPLEARGHTWWKVPMQPEYDCVECGARASTLKFTLVHGALRPAGVVAGPDFGLMSQAIGAGHTEFLLPTGVRPDTPQALVEFQQRQRLLPLVPTGMEEVAVIPHDKRASWDGEAGGPCKHCGSCWELHRPHAYVAGRMVCPQEGVDVT